MSLTVPPMKAKTLLVLLGLASLAACAQSPVATSVAPTAAAGAQETPSSTSQLTEPLLYRFLLGEIAGQRGDLSLSAEAYAELARQTRDVRIVRRAIEIATYARQPGRAIEMAELWVELEPASPVARQSLGAMLIGAGRFDEARPQLEAMLRVEKRPLADAFSQLHGLLARHRDKKAIFDLVKELAGAYPALPEAHLAVAQAAVGAGLDSQALAALDEAARMSPGWEALALLRGQVLSRGGNEPVLAYWRSFLKEFPKSERVRLAYAKQLAKAGQYADARREFETLVASAPENPDFRFAIGLLAMQTNDLDAAEKHLGMALEQGYHDEGLIQVYLGQVNEGRQRYQKALDWYLKVGRGERYFESRLKAAVVLGKLSRVEEGRALLRELSAEEASDQTLVVQAEAQLLREAKRFPEAFDLLQQSLARSPDLPELLYDRAMIAEKLNKLDVLEADLRRLIVLRPENAQAYNALGYTLVDRTDRVDEGLALLEKALKLSPGDPFILDSMGWAFYRGKRFDEAVDYLRRAFAARPDPEIAAHLGEALWAKGAREEARKVWQGSLRNYPDNDTLRETLSRFGK